MSAAGGDALLERVRQALESRVQESSLRQAAREVGMSPTGLQKLLGGTRPYAATIRKLERWYVRERARYGESVDVSAAQAAVRVLLQDLPPSARARAMRRVAATVEAEYGRSARPTPAWLSELLRRLEEGPKPRPPDAPPSS